MSAARPITDTERNWYYSALILTGSIILFGAVYAIEMNQGRWNDHLRLVYQPSETVMRLFGVSHVLIATLYLLTSRRMRSLRSSLVLASTTALGVAVCFSFAGLGGISPRLASTAFFLYFIVHDFRDQVYFYFEHHDAPEQLNRDVVPRLLFWMPLCVVLTAFSLVALATAAGVPGTAEFHGMLASFPAGVSGGLGVLLLATAASLLRLQSLWRRSGEGALSGHLRRHRPIYTVFAGSLLLVLVGGFLTRHNHVIVILHVTAWYVFFLRRLRRNPPPSPPPRRLSWQWLRTTPAGFNVLHLGTLLVLVTAAAVWVYGFRSDPDLIPLWVTLDVKNFQYWTLMHVTMSFYSR